VNATHRCLNDTMMSVYKSRMQGCSWTEYTVVSVCVHTNFQPIL